MTDLPPRTHSAGHHDYKGTNTANTTPVQLRAQAAVDGPPACGRDTRPRNPPPPVLLLEHCRGLANLLHTCQLATAYNLNNAMFSHTGADD